MDKKTLTTHGVFSWCELLTTDVTAARRFYGELLGWTLSDMDDSSMPYTIIKNGENDIGGMMEITDEMPNMKPMWGPYVTVDDVDKRVDVAKKLGAKVLVEAQDVPNVGRFAMIMDPQGAPVSLITYAENLT